MTIRSAASGMREDVVGSGTKEAKVRSAGVEKTSLMTLGYDLLPLQQCARQCDCVQDPSLSPTEKETVSRKDKLYTYCTRWDFSFRSVE